MDNAKRHTTSRTPGKAESRTLHYGRATGMVLLVATALSGCQADRPGPDHPDSAPPATPHEARRTVEHDFSRLVGTWRETDTDSPTVLTIRADGSIKGNFGSDKYPVAGKAEPRGDDKWRIVIGSAPQPETIDDITGIQIQGRLINDTQLAMSGDDEDTVLTKIP